MQEKFNIIENTYNLHRNTISESRLFRTQKHIIESLASITPKIWLLVSRDIKSSFMLHIFKNKVNNWLTSEYLCKLSKRYIENRGYL